MPDDPIDVAGRPSSLSIRLSAGDVLYVPRGWIHEAQSGPETSSWHLTLGIHPATWYDVLARALEISALREPILRRALPPGCLHRDTALVEMEHQFERLWQVARDGGTLLGGRHAGAGRGTTIWTGPTTGRRGRVGSCRRAVAGPPQGHLRQDTGGRVRIEVAGP